jgi:hypothetical protein
MNETYDPEGLDGCGLCIGQKQPDEAELPHE